MIPGINIFSGSKGLGGALTNPTCLSKRKGSIVQDYPVVWHGKSYPDAEAVYQENKFRYPLGDQRMEFMISFMVCKLEQHPRLYDTIVKNGGAEWLKTCRHFSGARTPGFKWWEGVGLKSPFISCLVQAFMLVEHKRLEAESEQDDPDSQTERRIEEQNERRYANAYAEWRERQAETYSD